MSGVLSSWVTPARNSDFARAAATSRRDARVRNQAPPATVDPSKTTSAAEAHGGTPTFTTVGSKSRGRPTRSSPRPGHCGLPHASAPAAAMIGKPAARGIAAAAGSARARNAAGSSAAAAAHSVARGSQQRMAPSRAPPIPTIGFSRPPPRHPARPARALPTFRSRRAPRGSDRPNPTIGRPPRRRPRAARGRIRVELRKQTIPLLARRGLVCRNLSIGARARGARAAAPECLSRKVRTAAASPSRSGASRRGRPSEFPRRSSNAADANDTDARRRGSLDPSAARV